MQCVSDKSFEELQMIAFEKGIKVQELVRAIMIPEWLHNNHGMPVWPTPPQTAPAKPRPTVMELLEEHARGKSLVQPSDRGFRQSRVAELKPHV
jgi:hypothetical protein